MTSTPQGGVLWLDLSAHVGHAYATAEMEEPRWGVWNLPGDPDLGLRGLAYENELLSAFDLLRPSLVGIEAPLPPNQQKDFYTAQLLIGLAFMTEVAAKRWRIRSFIRSCDTVRREVIGRCRRSDEEKRNKVSAKDGIVKPWIESMGWRIIDNNSRDAAVGLAYEFGYRHRKTPPAEVRMFAERPAVRLP